MDQGQEGGSFFGLEDDDELDTPLKPGSKRKATCPITDEALAQYVDDVITSRRSSRMVAQASDGKITRRILDNWVTKKRENPNLVIKQASKGRPFLIGSEVVEELKEREAAAAGGSASFIVGSGPGSLQSLATEIKKDQIVRQGQNPNAVFVDQTTWIKLRRFSRILAWKNLREELASYFSPGHPPLSQRPFPQP
jgi:hypothetical protein